MTKPELERENDRLKKRLKKLTLAGSKMSRASWNLGMSVAPTDTYDRETMYRLSCEWDEAVRDDK